MQVCHPPIRIIIADDHPVVREGIVSIIGKASDLCIISQTGIASEIEPLVLQLKPDILVMDLKMPNLDPVALVCNIKEKQPATGILVLSAFDDEAYVTSLLSSGALGYVLKEEAPDNLVKAIHSISAGQPWLSHRIANRLAMKASRPVSEYTNAELSQRETEVLRQLALGYDNEAIAQKLFISKRTVQNHISLIYAKLGGITRTEAVLYAIRSGIVRFDEVKSNEI